MNKRLGISKKDQRKFFRIIRNKSGLKWNVLANLCEVSEKTLKDWARAKYTTPYEKGLFLRKKFHISLPKNFKILEPYWYIDKYARKGASARQKLYGLLGDRKTRQKGGLISQQKRRENPEKYRILGCIVRKDLKKPLKFSADLAELFGIILGDGGITNNQIRVTLNRKTDKNYAIFVKRLMYGIFGETPSINKRENVLNLTLSGVNLVGALEKLGLRRGNKVLNQVAIPKWILQNNDYSRFCVRGLIDTDGSVYFHKHKTNGINYLNMGLTFTNHSKPLLYGVNNILLANHFTPSIVRDKKIYIYKLDEIKRYFKIIGSSNPKHIGRFNFYLNKRSK